MTEPEQTHATSSVRHYARRVPHHRLGAALGLHWYTMALEETLLGPVSALLGTALGAWLIDHYSGRRWLRQQRWTVREKRYMDLLEQLSTAETALQAQSDYYIEPRSEYIDHGEDERFIELGATAAKALRTVKELAGPAEVFLSDKTIDALRRLVREDWNAAFDASYRGEYIDKALPLVKTARSAVVAEAKAQLDTPL